MTTLHIHLFGQLRLFWGERPYPFKALPKVEPILAYLLLNQDTPTLRDSFAFKLWPDVTEKQAKGRLRRHLYDLRRALPTPPEDQPWLLITPQTVQWNAAAPYWLDVAAFEHLSQQPHRLAEAIALYTDVVVFHPLEPEHIRRIVDIQLTYLHRRLGEREIALVLDPAARDRLALAGFDPVYGARPLRRAIQQQLENPLAQRILRGDFGPGDTIRVTAEGDSLVFRKAAKDEAA
jgi:hypothetical protein